MQGTLQSLDPLHMWVVKVMAKREKLTYSDAVALPEASSCLLASLREIHLP